MSASKDASLPFVTLSRKSLKTSMAPNCCFRVYCRLVSVRCRDESLFCFALSGQRRDYFLVSFRECFSSSPSQLGVPPFQFAAPFLSSSMILSELPALLAACSASSAYLMPGHCELCSRDLLRREHVDVNRAWG